MEIAITESILAAIVLERSSVVGSIPVFIAKDEEDQARLAKLLSNILRGSAHDLENGTMIIVKH